MRWYWKCLLNSAKALVPFQTPLRRLKHEWCGYRTDPVNDRETINQGLLQLEWIRAVRPVDQTVVLEVGTGWKPTIPLLFSLAGAREVLLTDLRPLCSAATLRATLDTVRAERQQILSRLAIDADTFDRTLTWHPSWTFDDALRHFRLTYLAPCDCQRLPLPSSSVDLIISRAVLEHIPPPVVAGIFRESARLLRPGGLACHIIDNSDHWQHADPVLSRVNFLRFSDAVFRWTCLNGLDYQNRLRHKEYVQLLKDAGLTIARQEGPVDARARTDIAGGSIPVAESFRRFTPDELAILTTYVLAAAAPVDTGNV